MNKAFSLILSIFLATSVHAAQIQDTSLNRQYNLIFRSADHWQQTGIANLHKTYMDSLNLNRQKLHEANAKLSEQAKTIATLQSDVNTKEQSLEVSQTKVNTVSLLGMHVSKATYNILMWGLVLILGASLGTVLYLSASLRREAASRIQAHEEVTAEFAAYKAKANEKEKKLARELQTERNKVEELMNR
jgi:hypothetical protein